MKIRALVAAALALLALAAVASTTAAATAADPWRVLAFSRTEGFRHGSIPNAHEALRRLAAVNGFAVDSTEGPGAFTDANLRRYRAVIFLLTTGDVLDEPEQAAFERFMARGGGYLGVHSAADTEYGWEFYGRMVGTYFRAHPLVQPATVVVEDRVHPSTAHLPERWDRSDEWYAFRSNPRQAVHVLASLDEKSYMPDPNVTGTNGLTAMGDHPIAWCRDFGGGRVWYTAAGHTPESWSEPAYLGHVRGGILTAAGVEPADCRNPAQRQEPAPDPEVKLRAPRRVARADLRRGRAAATLRCARACDAAGTLSMGGVSRKLARRRLVAATATELRLPRIDAQRGALLLLSLRISDPATGASRTSARRIAVGG